MNYRDKYIKYKTKYIELKNIQIGSSIKSAKEALLSFISKLSKKDSEEIVICNSFNLELPVNFKSMEKLKKLILGFKFSQSLNHLPNKNISRR